MKYALLISVLFLLSMEQKLSAQNIVVGWGGDSVSNTTDLNGFASQTILTGVNIDPLSRQPRLLVTTDALSDDSIVGIPFSQTTQLSPLTGYTGQRFYGGVSAGALNTNTPSTIDRVEISNHGPNDTLDFNYALNGKLHDSRLAIFFDKTDFLAGGNLAPVRIGANSSLSIRFNANTSSQVNNDGELRWMVREGGQWWISAANSAGQPNIRSKDDTNSGGIKNNTTFTSSAASGELTYWAPFDPLTGGGLLNLNFEPLYSSRFVVAPSTNPFVVKNFTNISAVGFYIEGDQFSTNVFQFEVESMNFSLLVVPEMSTYLMLTLTLLIIGSYYGFRRGSRGDAKPEEKVEEAVEQKQTADYTDFAMLEQTVTA